MSKAYIEWGRQYWKNGADEAELHAIFGIVSEAGELADLAKKSLRDNTPINKDNVVDEVGDICYYLARLLDVHESSFEEAFEKNRVKLDYRMAFGKNKEMEALLQKQVTIISNPENITSPGQMRYG